MRNISQTVGVALYGPEEEAKVKLLQEKLNELGCDVGTPDGVVGAKTREQARLCRSFADADMPDALNVTTLDAFVDLYSRPDAAGLPPGTLAEPPPYVIHIASRNDHHPEGLDTIYSFNTLIERPGKDMMPIDFILIGSFIKNVGRFLNLNVILDHEISDDVADAVRPCANNSIEDRGDDGKRLILKFGGAREGTYRIKNVACLLDALPKPMADKAGFLVDHFNELAATLVREGSVTPIANENVQAFIKNVADGSLVVTQAE